MGESRVASCFLGAVDGGVVLPGLMRLDRQGRGGIVERWADLGWRSVTILTTCEKVDQQHEQNDVKVNDLS